MATRSRKDDPAGVVVVGAGLAGLTAALDLARARVPVTLLEASANPGGRARSTGPAGYALNLGPHAIASAGPGTRILERLGIELPGRPPAYHRARLLVDGRVVSPLDRRRGGGGARSAVGLARLLFDARRGDPDGSVDGWLTRRLPEPRARGGATVLARLSTYADSLADQSADLFAEALRSGTVRYLDGGWGAVVDRLRAAAAAAGADLRSGAPVATVEPSGDTWHVVTRDGTRFQAAAVVIAAGGPHAAASLLRGPARDTLTRWAARATPVRMASLDVALDRRPAGPSAVFGVDEPLYLSVQSDTSRIAPDGAAVVQVARFLPAGEHAPDDTRRRLESLLDQTLPDWRGAVVQARYLPDLVVTHDACLVASGGRRGRPGPTVPDVPRLYVAGDWAGSRGTLSQASIVSAATAAAAAARDVHGGSHRRQESAA